VLAVGLPILAIVVGAVAYEWIDRGAPPGFRPTAVPMEVGAVTREHKGVHLEGTAHYLGIRQTTSGGVDYYVFPLFPPGDTQSRSVHVLVRTTTAPEALLDFANVAIEGLARTPSYEIPVKTIESIRRRGYVLEDDYVLIEAFD
jgi:hypothetical protein